MIKLLVGVLPFQGEIKVGTAASLSDERFAGLREGVHVDVKYLPGAHYIAEGYSKVVKFFLEHDYDKLAFVEWDVSWTEHPGMAGALCRLAKLPHDYVGGATRYKSDPVEFMVGWDETQTELRADEHGCLSVDWIPQGFSVASRAMCQAMWDAAADREYLMHGELIRQVFYEDFRPGLGKFGQDIGFCHDWRAMGGKVHVKPNLTLTHTACVNHAYTGNLFDWLKAQMTPEERAQDAEERGAA